MAVPGLAEHASRSLAAFRLIMAALYGIWFHFNTGVPYATTPFLAFYWSYLAISLALFLITLRSWWWDFQLSAVSFLVDVIAFAASLLVVGTINADFISPIFAFFTFLLVSAFVRWSQTVMPFVAALLVILSLSAGLAIHWLGEPIDLVRTIRRFTYLILIALILTRFCINRGAYVVPRFKAIAGETDKEPQEALLDYAMAASGARSAALVWAASEEPWTGAQLAGRLGRRRHRLSAEAELEANYTLMFDTYGRRALMLDGQGRLKPATDQSPSLASELGLAEGIVCPLAGPSGSGALLLGDIPGLSWEDIFVADNIAREVVIGLEEQAAIASAREVAEFRLKSDLARDLHDSVAQSLAGTRFRLEGLRQSAAEGKACLEQIDSICEALTREQAQVREVIDRLRQESPRTGMRDLASELSALGQQLAARWGIDCRVDGPDGGPVQVDTPTLFEIQQLVREGVSNAVRHGSATRVLLAVAMDQSHQLELTLEDDGSGFDEKTGPVRPRSISERVAGLAGTLAVDSLNGKTRLCIRIPLKAGRCAQ